MHIYYRPKFLREFRKLPQHIKEKFVEREGIFRLDQFAPALRTHKLRGQFFGWWAFYIDYRYRVIFKFADEGRVFFYSVGDHDIYD